MSRLQQGISKLNSLSNQGSHSGLSGLSRLSSPSFGGSSGGRGKLEKTAVGFRDNDHLLQIIDRIVSKVGRRVDETNPMVDARLPDGSRVNAVIPPIALDGASLSIRRFGANPLKLEDLLNYKAFTPEMAMLMEACIKARLNVIISGDRKS